nr:MAG TPA: hypothetical protein [Caudoviricetes sp.]
MSSFTLQLYCNKVIHTLQVLFCEFIIKFQYFNII